MNEKSITSGGNNFLSQKNREIANILACNKLAEKKGLTLNESQAAEIAVARENSLIETGRVEFGGGVSEKLIRAFYDSPYIDGDNYADILCELTEIFYLYKDETQDALSDDALVLYMKNAFNGRCGGSAELLKEDELSSLVKSLNAKDGKGCRL